MRPTFKEFLNESLADLAKGKGEPARATYPKTNFKRYADAWNERLGKWVESGLKKGYEIKKRVSLKSEELVLDKINGDELVSTAVITGHDNVKSGDHTFDFYNMQDPHSPHKYRVLPLRTSYVEGWKWEPIEGDDLHHSDQRNVFTSNTPRTMKNSRVQDGEEPSWAKVMGSKKGKRKS